MAKPSRQKEISSVATLEFQRYMKVKNAPYPKHFIEWDKKWGSLAPSNPYPPYSPSWNSWNEKYANTTENPS